MFDAVKKIINGLHKGLRRTKELAYNFVNFFGAGLKTNHFNKQDLKNHHQWYDDPPIKNLLESVTQYPDQALRYFKIKAVDTDIFEPEHKFTNLDTTYLDDRGSELLCSYAENILALIKSYTNNSHKKQGLVKSFFNADSNKMTPDLMVLSFVSEYIQKEMIKYNNNPDDLKRIENLIAYFSRLSGFDNVKSDSSFLKVIVGINAELNSAKNKLSENINRTSSVTTLGRVENLIRTVSSDLLRLLTSVCQFNTKSAKFSAWNDRAQKMLAHGSIKDETDLDDYQKELKLASAQQFSNNDNACEAASSLCPALVDRKNTANKAYQKTWSALIKLQEHVIQSINLFHVISSINIEVNKQPSSRTIADSQIRDVLFRLDCLIKELQVELRECQTWRDYFNEYCQQHFNTDDLRVAFDAIVLRCEVIEKNLTTLREKITYYRENVSACSDKNAEPNQHIEKIVKALCKHHGFEGKSKVVIANEIREFINTLRENDVFDEKVAAVLSEYFCIESKGDPNNVKKTIQLVTHLKTDSSTALLGAGYLNVFLQIIIKLHKFDFAQAQDTKTIVIEKILDFVIKNLLLHDASAIKILLVTMLEQVSLAKSAEEKHAKLKSVIQDHLKEVKSHILTMISANSALFDDDLLVDDSEKFESLVDKKGFIKIVLAFTRNVIIKINHSKKRFTQLKANTVSFNEIVSPENITRLSNDYLIIQKEYSHISDLLLATTTALSNVSTSIIHLERELKIIEDEVSEITADDQHEIDSLLHQLELEKLILQADAENIVIRIQESQNSAVELKKVALDAIGSQVFDMLCAYNSFTQFGMLRYHLFQSAKGSNIFFEFAAIKYMYTLVIKTDELSSVKLLAFLNLLKSGKNYTSIFQNFLNSIYDAMSRIITPSQIVQMPLLTTAWRPKNLLVSEEEIHLLQNDIEKSVDEYFTSSGIRAVAAA